MLPPAPLEVLSLVCWPFFPLCTLGAAFGRDSVFSNTLLSLFPFSFLIGVQMDSQTWDSSLSLCLLGVQGILVFAVLQIDARSWEEYD